MIETLLPCPFCGQTPQEVRVFSFEKTPSTRCQNKDCFMSLTPMVWPSVESWNKRDETAFLQFRSSLDREHTEKMKALKLLIILESTIDFLLEFIKSAGLDLPKDVLAQWQEYKESKSL